MRFGIRFLNRVGATSTDSDRAKFADYLRSDHVNDFGSDWVGMDQFGGLGHDVDHVPGAPAFAVPHSHEAVGPAGLLEVAGGAGFLPYFSRQRENS